MKISLPASLLVALLLGPPALAKKEGTSATPKKEQPAPGALVDPRVPVAASKPPPPRFELRTAPLALIARWITLEGLYLLGGERWAVGPSLVFYESPAAGSMLWLSQRGRSIGAVATYYFKPVSEPGWYGTLRYLHDSYTYYPHNSRAGIRHESYQGHSLTMVAGYRFVLPWNAFLLMGGGAQGGLYERAETKEPTPGAFTSSSSRGRFSLRLYVEGKAGLRF